MFSMETKSLIAGVMTMGFDYDIEGGDHVVRGHGMEIRHTSMVCIMKRIGVRIGEMVTEHPRRVTELLEANNALVERARIAEKRNHIAREYLEKLACLGGIGGAYGNSTGNTIAREAIMTLSADELAHVTVFPSQPVMAMTDEGLVPVPEEAPDFHSGRLDNVHFLNCPENNMKMTVRELLDWMEKGMIESVAITGELRIAPDKVNVISGYVRGDNGSVFVLMGALHSLANRIDRESVE